MTAKKKPKPSGDPTALPVYKCGHYGHVNQAGNWCGQNRIKGTTACRRHGGKPLEQQIAEGKIRLELAAWTLDGHDGSNLDPRVEILRLIAFWKWKANFYGTLLHKAYEAAEQMRTAHAAQKLLLAEEETENRYHANGDFAGVIHEPPELQVARDQLEQIFVSGGVTALVGHKYDVDRDGRVFPVDEGIRALVQLEQKAHEMVGKFCHLAVQAKVADVKIQLAEQVGLMIQTIITGVLRDVGVDTDMRVQQLIVTHIDRVAGLGNISGFDAIAA